MQNSESKKQVTVIIGSGFSAALTGGKAPILGNNPLPILTGLTESLLTHMKKLQKERVSLPFSINVVNDSVAVLENNNARPEAEKYNFEELISLLSIESILLGPNSSTLPELPSVNPKILKCLLYCLSDFFVTSLFYDPTTQRANRNFFYKVNDQKRAETFKERVWKLVDEFETSFISFNWDGIIESFLDHWLGQNRGFRYNVGISHGIPLAVPGTNQSWLSGINASRFPRLPLVIKPHGSIHFFQLKEELQELVGGGPAIGAVTPRLDIGFDPKTMQRDYKDARSWEFVDPTPVIIPPLLNKDTYFDSNYFKTMLRLTIESIQKAQYVLVIGFSMPPSDLHMGAAFKAVDWSEKKLGLILRADSKNKVEAQWKRAAKDAEVTIINDTGMPVESVSDINSFWDSVQKFLSE